MIITNAIDLSSDFTALAEKLMQMQAELQIGQNQFSETVTEKLNTVSDYMTEGLSSAGQQTETAVNRAKSAIESAVTDAKQTIISSVTKAKTELTEKGTVKRVLHVNTTSSTVTIPQVDLNKAFISMNMTLARSLAGNSNRSEYWLVQPEFTSSTSIQINKSGWNGSVTLEVIEYA